MMNTAVTLFTRGGPVMWPLLLCSVVAVTFIIERVLFWWREQRRESRPLIDRLFELTEQAEHEKALALTAQQPDAVARVLLTGLAHREHGLRESMEVAAADEVDRMKRGLAILDTIVTMAPLLGILGTVTGIIRSFDLLGSSQMGDPRAISAGIAEALITTAAGLVVSLPTLVAFNFFVARVQAATKRIEQIGTQFEVAYRRGRAHAAKQRV
jgi:biopolymer transport protein ExbB